MSLIQNILFLNNPMSSNCDHKYGNNNESSFHRPQSLNELLALIHLASENEYIDVEYLWRLMVDYECNLDELANYANFQSGIYTRNLIDAGNGKFNVMLLCWDRKVASLIHDHSNSHCIMKCVKGTLIETRYSHPSNVDANNDEEKISMNVVARNIMNVGEASYMHDKIGLHRVQNESETEQAMSLHLYMPPFSSCHVFGEQDSHANTCPVKFHTINGEPTIKH
jgi:cysteine dioxygenase